MSTGGWCQLLQLMNVLGSCGHLNPMINNDLFSENDSGGCSGLVAIRSEGDFFQVWVDAEGRRV